MARYDSRGLSSRRQKTHTYSRYNKGRPAWSSGRWISRYEGTETWLQKSIHLLTEFTTPEENSCTLRFRAVYFVILSEAKNLS